MRVDLCERVTYLVIDGEATGSETLNKKACYDTYTGEFDNHGVSVRNKNAAHEG